MFELVLIHSNDYTWSGLGKFYHSGETMFSGSSTSSMNPIKESMKNLIGHYRSPILFLMSREGRLEAVTNLLRE